MSKEVVVQNWTETERGWGQRPDGYTVHLSLEDCRKYRADFMENQRSTLGEEVPDEYTFPSGEPYLASISLPDLKILELERKPEAEGGTDSSGLWGKGNFPKETQTGKQVSIDRLPVLANPIVEKARDSVNQDFEGKLRKVPKGSGATAQPASTHLHAVARILAENGFDYSTVAAGYLHDHLEDLPELWDKQKLSIEFGKRITEIVDYVTQQDKSLSWEERNRLYNERLKNAPDESLAVSAADKIHNLSSTIPWLKRGYKVTDLLKRGWQQNSKKFHELEHLFTGKVPNALLERFQGLLAEFDRYGSKHT